MQKNLRVQCPQCGGWAERVSSYGKPDTMICIPCWRAIGDDAGAPA